MCISINQQTLEQKPVMNLRDQYLFNCEDQPLCAWCLSEQGLDFGNGSHGICPQHAASLLQQYRERNVRRQHVH
jgi:hypothetical protein